MIDFPPCFSTFVLMASLKGVFDFEKDVEYSFNFDKDIISSNGFNNSALILDPGIMEEKEYDFFEDDLEAEMSDTIDYRSLSL